MRCLCCPRKIYCLIGLKAETVLKRIVGSFKTSHTFLSSIFYVNLVLKSTAIDDRNFVDEIMEQANAVLIIQQLQEKLKEEQRKRQEFYDTIKETDKVEFINGEIIYHPPVVKEHNDAIGSLLVLLDTYVRLHKLGWVGFNNIMVQFTRNDYEPDLCFFNIEKSKDFKKGQMIFPVPDLAVEVLSKSKKSLARDRKIKFDDYEIHGVSEYWMIDPDRETIEQYVLEEGKYQLVLKSGEGSHSQSGGKRFCHSDTDGF